MADPLPTTATTAMTALTRDTIRTTSATQCTRLNPTHNRENPAPAVTPVAPLYDTSTPPVVARVVPKNETIPPPERQSFPASRLSRPSRTAPSIGMPVVLRTRVLVLVPSP